MIHTLVLVGAVGDIDDRDIVIICRWCQRLVNRRRSTSIIVVRHRRWRWVGDLLVVNNGWRRGMRLSHWHRVVGERRRRGLAQLKLDDHFVGVIFLPIHDARCENEDKHADIPRQTRNNGMWERQGNNALKSAYSKLTIVGAG